MARDPHVLQAQDVRGILNKGRILRYKVQLFGRHILQEHVLCSDNLVLGTGRIDASIACVIVVVADIHEELIVVSRQRTRRGCEVAHLLKRIGNGRSYEGLGIELHVREHIVQELNGLRMLQIADTGTHALPLVSGIHVVLQNGVLVVQEVVVDLGLEEEGNTRLPHLLSLQVVVHGLVLLANNAEVLHEEIEILGAIGAKGVPLENPHLRFLVLLLFHVHPGDHVVRIPHLFVPSS